MKSFLFILLTTLVTSVLLITIGNGVIRECTEIDKRLLEISTPISGRIDMEFLQENFVPAYEQ